MNVYTLPDGETVGADDQFQILNTKYPAGWLRSATDNEIASAGIAVTVIADPPPPAPPLPIVQVNSTATPALSGVYAFDAESQAKMLAVVTYVQENQKFPDGLTSFPYPDANGSMHEFTTTAQFISLASALADYVTALDLGQTPSAPLTIP